jgi:hypothetical protein
MRRIAASRRWRFDNKGSWVISSPALAEHVVVFGSTDGIVYALE